VAAVQVRGGGERDEELRTILVGAGVRHREHSGDIEVQRRIDLVHELVARAAGAVALRIAALDDEAWQHAVELQSVVEVPVHQGAGARIVEFERALGQTDEVADRHRCFRRFEPADECPERRLEDGVETLGCGDLVHRVGGSSRPARRHGPDDDRAPGAQPGRGPAPAPRRTLAMHPRPLGEPVRDAWSRSRCGRRRGVASTP
jgi:hypothetical protein